nr:hypothetical protein 6 [bacterium]
MEHQILIGDCREALKTLEKESVHLVVTSPPYNVNIDYGKWNDQMSFEGYRKFAREWLGHCYRVLRDDGRICVNIPIYTHKNYQRNLLMEHHQLMTDIGFVERDTILWVKTFQSKIARAQKIYGSWNPANPRMFYPCEAILVMNKKRPRMDGRKSDLSKSEYVRWGRNLWFFTPEADRSHPAPFPEEMPKRLIKFFSFVGQTVLDPFLGSGTTMKVAVELGRSCIGVEMNDGYLELIKKKVGDNGIQVAYHKGTAENEPAGNSEMADLLEINPLSWEHEIDRFFDF